MADPKIVYNHDVAGLQARMNRFITELRDSSSSDNSEMSVFDQSRLVTYLSAIRAYQSWAQSTPQLDLPETDPRSYVLEADPVVGALENESVKDIIRMMELARDEMINSQSARKPSGLIAFDGARLTAIIDKVDNFLANYVAVATPLDLPESSPMAPMVAPGKTGV